MYPARNPDLFTHGAKKECIDAFKGNLHLYNIGYCLILKLSLRISKNWILLSPVFVFIFSARRHFGFHGVIRLPKRTKAETIGRHKIQNAWTQEI